VAFLAVALGGALGAVLRWTLGDVWPDGSGFPWTTFGINVTGSLVLAWLPALGPVRRNTTLAAGLGPGLMGGYTTLSAYSEQTRALLAGGHSLTALLYAAGTLATCMVAVAVVSRLYPPADAVRFAAEGGDQ
jgi:CrcB protein